jgi:Mg2+/Co2+ transporter CorB
MLTLILTVCFSLLLAGFFAASETALTGASEVTMHKLAQQGSKSAKKVEELRRDKERLISTLMLGNSVLHIFASAMATKAFVDVFGAEGVAYATVLMTVSIVIFAEVLPKSYAFEHPDKVAVLVAPTLGVMARVLDPFSSAIRLLVRILTYVCGLRSDTQEKRLGTELDHLRGAIELHHHRGVVIKQDRDMLGGVLDLGHVDVAQIMVHRRQVEMVNIDQPLEEILKTVTESSYTRLPLWKENQENIIGVLHSRDLFQKIYEAAGNLTQVDVMQLASPPWFIPENTSLSHQLHAFRKRRSHFALVVDEYGALKGIVTLEDILEEIVGQIEDEHDESLELITPEAGGAILVAGHLPIRELNRAQDWHLPDNEANTVAGLVMFETETIPNMGDVYMLHGFQFEIVAKSENQITCIRIHKPSASSGQAAQPSEAKGHHEKAK